MRSISALSLSHSLSDYQANWPVLSLPVGSDHLLPILLTAQLHQDLTLVTEKDLHRIVNEFMGFKRTLLLEQLRICKC